MADDVPLAADVLADELLTDEVEVAYDPFEWYPPEAGFSLLADVSASSTYDVTFNGSVLCVYGTSSPSVAFQASGSSWTVSGDTVQSHLFGSATPLTNYAEILINNSQVQMQLQPEADFSQVSGDLKLSFYYSAFIQYGLSSNTYVYTYVMPERVRLYTGVSWYDCEFSVTGTGRDSQILASVTIPYDQVSGITDFALTSYFPSTVSDHKYYSSTSTSTTGILYLSAAVCTGFFGMDDSVSGGPVDLSPITGLLGTIIEKLNSIDSGIDIVLSDLTDANGFLSSSNGLLSSLLSQSQSIYDVLFGKSGGSIYTFLGTLKNDVHDMVLNQFPVLFRWARSWYYDEASNSLKSRYPSEGSVGITEILDTNFKDLDSLLLKNFGSSSGFSYYTDSFTFTYLSPDASLLELLSAVGSTLSSTLGYSDALTPMLFGSGDVDFAANPVLSFSVIQGFMGLNYNMEKALIGGHGDYGQYSRLTFDGNLNKSTKITNYYDLLHALVGIGSDIQNPLSQLQAVLAGDADLELHRNTQENIDSVTDNFTGSGAGSVSSGDISDASGLTSGIGNAFGGNQVSTGDAFRAATDLGNFDFLSEECASALDAVAYPVAVVLDVGDEDNDSWLDGFVVDEDGFYSLSDLSGWSFLDYLGKEG